MAITPGLRINASLLGLEWDSSESGRKEIALETNRTASYIPEPLACWRPGEATEELTLSLASDLQNHFEMRIQLFCQQLFLVYKTQLQLSEASTVATAGHGSGPLLLDAAHSSTLPRLRYKSPSEKDGPLRVLAEGSYFYDSWNATVLLPAWINRQVDVAIDAGKGGVKGSLTLRDKCIQILNATSKGEITPESGLEAFLSTLEHTLEFLEKGSESPCKCIVLKNYLQVVKVYQALLAKPKPNKEASEPQPNGADAAAPGKEEAALLCKLGSSRETAPSETFYLEVRNRMLYIIIFNVQVLRDMSSILSSTKAVTREHAEWVEWLAWLAHQERISPVDFLQPGETIRGLTKTKWSYVNLCLQSGAVRGLVREYLASETHAVVTKDLAAFFNKIRSSSTAVKLHSSDKARRIYGACLDAIAQTSSVKNPAEVSRIVRQVLHELNFRSEPQFHQFLLITETRAIEWRKSHPGVAQTLLTKLQTGPSANLFPLLQQSTKKLT